MEILPGDSTAKTLYFRAIRAGSVEDVKVLVRYGADVNWRDEDTTFTGILFALALGKKDLVEFLLSKGADVNLTDEKGRCRWTPLMWVCQLGLPDRVERLPSSRDPSQRSSPHSGTHGSDVRCAVKQCPVY